MHIHICRIELFCFLDFPTRFVKTKILQEAISGHEALFGRCFR